MAANTAPRCLGCMSLLTEDGVCPVCGYDPSKAQLNINYLAPGYVLGGRYLVGKMTSCDTEGAWYVGFDGQQNFRVWIREYAPKAIIVRDYDHGIIRPLPGSEAQYKALMSDFEDLCASIRRLSSSEKVLPILDTVRANNTVYAVYRYIKMITLESFLKRSGGRLSWRHTKKLLMPLFHTVAGAHNAGLIHRGLSPRTVEIDQKGTLWLTNFSIAAARTNKSELSAQLYEGYAAPEQYSQSTFQGTWTDVYALGAITYRAVMGADPPSAMDRVYGDDLLDHAASPDMTDSVMAAINKALAVEVEDRTQTAERYIADLLANEGSNTAVYTAPLPRRSPQPQQAEDDLILPQDVFPVAAKPQEEAPAPRSRFDDLMAPAFDEKQREQELSRLKAERERRRAENKKKKKKNRRKAHPVLLLVFSAFIATSLLGMSVYWFANTYLADLINAVQNSEPVEKNQPGIAFSQDEQEQGNGKVANFVGATIESIQSNTSLDKHYEFKIVEGRSAEYEKGVVYEQSPKAGEALVEDNKTRITLYVSQGTDLVELPEVIGRPRQEVEMEFAELKIPYAVIPVLADAEPDTIVRCNRNPGDQIDITRSEKVILYVKKDDGSSKESSKEESDSEPEEEKTPSSRTRPSVITSSSQTQSSRSSSSSSQRSSSKDASSYPGLLKPRNP